MNTNYEWTKFYRELAAKILEYKADRNSLIDVLEDIYSDGEFSFNAYDHSGQKPFVTDRLTDIDPFSIYGNIHKYGEKNRATLLEKYKKAFKIKAKCPDVFPGVPRFIEQTNLVRFTGGSDARGKKDIEAFWTIFDLGYHFNSLKENNTEFKKAFDNAEPLPWAKFNVTKVLFYINPDYFVSLDNINLDHIKKADRTFKPRADKVISADDYLSLCLSLKEKHGITDFVAFSASAYSSKKNSDSTTKDSDVTYWIYAPGEKAYKWDEYYSKSLMGIGWGEIGDAKKVSSQTEIQRIMQRKYKDASSFKNDCLAVWQFVNEIKDGDIVFVKNGQTQIIGRGVVKSDYYYDSSVGDAYNHLRQVNWTHKGNWQFPNGKKAPLKTLTKISDTALINSLEKLFENIEDEVKEINSAFGTYIKSVEELLWENHNIILHGAPGTGKTHLAKELAKRNKAVTGFVQFHPSYDYTDFVEGLRPIRNDNGEIAFERKNGTFKDFCKKAQLALDKCDQDKKNESSIKYIFIIDEINRGEISKIFGELFFAIEPSYRGKDGKVETQYQNLNIGDDADLFVDGFYVPENVYIIGTMNNIDRSVESMDFAMRRRFYFKEITAAESADNFGIGGKDGRSNLARSMMSSLNKEIENEPTILGSDYQLGASYFSDLDKHFKSGDVARDDFEVYKLWNCRLKGLFNEYLRGEPNKVEIIQRLEEAYIAPYDNYTKENNLEK